MSAVLPATPRQSSFLRGLRRAVLDDFEPELVLVEQLAVLRAAGHRRSEAARLLGADPAAIRSAERRLLAAAEHLDAGDASCQLGRACSPWAVLRT
jgi:hypothetical protein